MDDGNLPTTEILVALKDGKGVGGGSLDLLLRPLSQKVLSPQHSPGHQEWGLL